jgi:NADPH2:quinone reductase
VEVDIAGNAHLLPRIVAQDGLCAAYGSSAAEVTFAFWPMIVSGAAVRYFIVYELPAPARQSGIADLSVWLENGWLMDCVGAEYPPEQIAEAHEAVAQGRVLGIVVVKP